MPQEDFDLGDDEVNAALQEIGEIAARAGATVVLTDHCLGCDRSENFSFYSMEEQSYNTILLDFDDCIEDYLVEAGISVPYMLVLICNECKKAHVNQDVLKTSLIWMALKAVTKHFE